jgi:hypothetical protein
MKNKIFYIAISAGLLVLTQHSIAQQQNRTRTVPTKNSNLFRSTNTQPQRVMLDTTNLPKYVTRDVTFEVPAEKGATIQIVNSTRNLDIRPWTESKVKIVTKVNVDESIAKDITMESLMERGGITVKSFGNRVNVETKTMFQLFDVYVQGMNPPGVNKQASGQNLLLTEHPVVSHGQPTTAETELREILNSQQEMTNRSNLYYSIVSGNSNMVMTLYIPEGCKLDVDNKGTNIIINTNIGNASFKMNRTNLDARDFGNLTVTGDYCTLNISNATEAEIELENGNLTAGVIGNLDLDCKNSEIEYEGGDYCYLRSQGDRINIDEIGKIDGRKLYGDLRIGKLKKSIDIEGANADIKIRHLMPEVEQIKVNNKYADLRLPVKQLSNYTVTFYGGNSTVFAPFEKIPAPVETLKLKPTEGEGAARKTVSETKKTNGVETGTASQPTHKLTNGDDYYFNSYRSFGEIAPVKFTASVGTTAGKFTRFDIVCHQCSVDFK